MQKAFDRYINGLVQTGDVIGRPDWEADSNDSPVRASSLKLFGSQGETSRGSGQGGHVRDSGCGGTRRPRADTVARR